MTNKTLMICKRALEAERVRVFKQTGGTLQSLERAIDEIKTLLCPTCQGTREVATDPTGQDLIPCPDCKKVPFEE